MELSDLVGKHVLTGCDMSNLKVKETWGDGYEDCSVINFVLDGKTYQAIEDPSDGYRSSMSEIKESDETVKNTFQGHEVLAQMRGKGQWGSECDILDLVDVVTGKVVLSVGTDNTDDYYPSFEAVFTPENLAANANN
jgi:hypothetical protein